MRDLRRDGRCVMNETASSDPLFELDLERQETARWFGVSRAATRAMRQHWRPQRRRQRDWPR